MIVDWRVSPACPHDCDPGFGPGAARLTSSAGRGTFSDSSSIWLKQEKIAALAPIPSASDTIAMAVTNGVLNSVRRANLRFTMVITK